MATENKTRPFEKRSFFSKKIASEHFGKKKAANLVILKVDQKIVCNARNYSKSNLENLAVYQKLQLKIFFLNLEIYFLGYKYIL
nr:hypothetical protein T20F5.1 - Caenorhabditis elegans [Caenorhabditis elegans]